ncbi:hypothetical protein QBC43DRAFT_339589 [Cladorrhinum sp. PSN259]|nr:hypothetical protein QBC43DRAFT_339589 [Cladorrhinum sp. PSN259]
MLATRRSYAGSGDRGDDSVTDFKPLGEQNVRGVTNNGRCKTMVKLGMKPAKQRNSPGDPYYKQDLFIHPTGTWNESQRDMAAEVNGRSAKDYQRDTENNLKPTKDKSHLLAQQNPVAEKPCIRGRVLAQIVWDLDVSSWRRGPGPLQSVTQANRESNSHWAPHHKASQTVYLDRRLSSTAMAAAQESQQTEIGPSEGSLLYLYGSTLRLPGGLILILVSVSSRTANGLAMVFQFDSGRSCKGLKWDGVEYGQGMRFEVLLSVECTLCRLKPSNGERTEPHCPSERIEIPSHHLNNFRTSAPAKPPLYSEGVAPIGRLEPSGVADSREECLSPASPRFTVAWKNAFPPHPQIYNGHRAPADLREQYEE